MIKTVVRRAMLYDDEAGCGGNEEDGCVVTKLDRIRNERIRGTTKVGERSKKVQESRLKWYNFVRCHLSKTNHATSTESQEAG